MIGRIIKKQKSTAKIEYFFYSSLSDQLLAKLRNNEEFALFCDCNTLEKIELKVGKRKDGYYLYNAKQGKTESHHPNCVKYSRYMGKSDYETGWREAQDEFTATLHADIFGSGKKDNSRVDTPKNSYEPRAKSCVNPTTQKGEVTLLGLVTKLNLIAWERCARNGSLPRDMTEFLKKVYGTMKKNKNYQ